jgi:hypothetical protein
MPRESGYDECGQLCHYISTSLYFLTSILFLKTPLSKHEQRKGTGETHVVNGVKLSLILEDHNLLL